MLPKGRLRTTESHPEQQVLSPKAPRGEPDKALGFLARMAGEFTSVLNMQDLINRVLESLRDEVEFDSCTIGLIDQSDAEALTLAGATGLRADFQGLIIPRGQGLNWVVIDSRTPLRVPDMHADPRVFRRDDRVRSGIYTPLIVHERAIGVLSAHRSEVDAFSQDDLDLLTVVARYLAGAFEVARLYDEADRRLRQLQALREIDMAITGSLDLTVTLNIFLDKVTTQLKVDAADVLLADESERTLHYAAGRGLRATPPQQSHLRLGMDFAGRAGLDRRPVVIPDLSKASGFRRTAWVASEGIVAYCAVPLVAKGHVKGVLELFHRSLLNPTRDWQDYLDALARQAAIAVNEATLFDALQRSNAELALAYDTTLEGWSRALDLRDRMTEGHSQRVTELTVRLTHAMGVSDTDTVHLRRGALLHDIGKMAIPDSILHKPGPLTEEEWAIMRRHPVYAYELLVPITYLRPALDIPYCHHERWNGAGYPRGLGGEQIPLAARIFAVADVWDALRSERPYRSAWAADKVREYIREQAGQHFDPRVVEVFLQLDSEAVLGR